jgi:hypothetical protein
VQVFKSQTKDISTYTEFLQRYDKLTANDKMKSAMTDIAFAITQKVWEDLPAESRGNCFFCIGGVNAINPFSAKAVKNEILVYHDVIPKDSKRIDPVEGTFYNMSGNEQPELDLLQYDEIYMDFNGSMAFFEDKWRARLSQPAVAQKVRLMCTPYRICAALLSISLICAGHIPSLICLPVLICLLRRLPMVHISRI